MFAKTSWVSPGLRQDHFLILNRDGKGGMVLRDGHGQSQANPFVEEAFQLAGLLMTSTGQGAWSTTS